jgi:hypothetical protein
MNKVIVLVRLFISVTKLLRKQFKGSRIYFVSWLQSIMEGGSGKAQQLTSWRLGSRGRMLVLVLVVLFLNPIWATKLWDGVTHIQGGSSPLVLSRNSLTDTPGGVLY